MPDPTQATAFIDKTSILTFTGASAGVVAFSATLRRLSASRALNHPIWPFFVCVAISIALARSSSALDNYVDWLIAALNSCMLFMAVVGVNESATAAFTPKPVGQGQQQGAPERKWLRSFFDQ